MDGWMLFIYIFIRIRLNRIDTPYFLYPSQVEACQPNLTNMFILFTDKTIKPTIFIVHIIIAFNTNVLRATLQSQQITYILYYTNSKGISKTLYLPVV